MFNLFLSRTGWLVHSGGDQFESRTGHRLFGFRHVPGLDLGLETARSDKFVLVFLSTARTNSCMVLQMRLQPLFSTSSAMHLLFTKRIIAQRCIV